MPSVVCERSTTKPNFVINFFSENGDHTENNQLIIIIITAFGGVSVIGLIMLLWFIIYRRSMRKDRKVVEKQSNANQTDVNKVEVLPRDRNPPYFSTNLAYDGTNL